MDDSFYLDMATNYADITKYKLLNFISSNNKEAKGEFFFKKNKNKKNYDDDDDDDIYYEDEPERTRVVRFFKKVSKMIASLCKYIYWTIKYLIIDSKILQKIIKGVASLYGESAPIQKRYNIKIDSPDDLKIKLEDYEKILNRRKTKIDRYKKDTSLEGLFSIIDPVVTNDNRGFTADFANNFVNDDRDANRVLSDMTYKFKTLYDNENASKLKVNKFIILKDNADIKDACRLYKDLLSTLFDKIYNPYVDYMKIVGDRFDIMKKNDRISKDIGIITNEDQLFFLYVNGLLSHIAKDIKNMNDRYIWLKEEIISNLVTISDNI